MYVRILASMHTSNEPLTRLLPADHCTQGAKTRLWRKINSLHGCAGSTTPTPPVAMVASEGFVDFRSAVIIVDTEPGISGILFSIASRNTDIHPIVVRPEHLAAVTAAVRPHAFIALHGACSLIVFQAMM